MRLTRCVDLIAGATPYIKTICPFFQKSHVRFSKFRLSKSIFPKIRIPDFEMSIIDFRNFNFQYFETHFLESLFSIGKQFVMSTFRFAVVAFTQYIEGALAPKRSLEGHSRPTLTRRYIYGAMEPEKGKTHPHQNPTGAPWYRKRQ